MPTYHSLQCPIKNCEYHFKIITGPISALEDHLFYDHGYFTKKERAEQLGIVRIGKSALTARELSRELAKEGVINA